MELTIPRVMISSGYSGLGKSLLGLGLAVALRKRNLSLSFCVKGPNLVQANLYHRLSRRYSRSIDSQILSSDQILECLRGASIGADIVIVEGEGGLYDGIRPGSLEGSDAEFASSTHTPSVILLDPGKYLNSFGAVARGFMDLARGFKVAGIIATPPFSADGDPAGRNRGFFDFCLHGFNMSPLLGMLPELQDVAPISRGRNAYREDVRSVFARQFFLAAGDMVESHVDVDRILDAANSAPPLLIEQTLASPQLRRCRIAVADDSCFSICFHDNLDLLRFYGAQLVPFSPLADSRLPDSIGGLYLPGGNIREYMRELADNLEMKNSIREFVEHGGVVYSEGAGTAYLCSEIEVGDERIPGIGIIRSAARQYDPFLSYTESVTTEDCIFGPVGSSVRGISSNNWIIENDGSIFKALNLSFAKEKPVPEGYSPTAQVLGTFCFNHFASNPAIVRHIVDMCETVRKLDEE